MNWQPLASLSRVAVLLAEVLAPARCIGCLIEGSWHCESCQARWRAGELQCLVCKNPQREGRTCQGCQDETPLRGLLSAGQYGSERLRRGIHWLKFRSVKAVAEPLTWLMLPQLRHVAPLPQLQQWGVLVPIPLHSRRHRQRGFNQAEELARVMSDLTKIPWMPALERSRATYRQTTLPVAMREANVEGAFRCADEVVKNLKDKRFILLVDDVTTSGSTLGAAARALPVNDGQQLWGFVVARG